jgi:hypothetical protein
MPACLPSSNVSPTFCCGAACALFGFSFKLFCKAKFKICLKHFYFIALNPTLHKQGKGKGKWDTRIKVADKLACNYTLIKKKTKFFSYVRIFRLDRLQSHI